MLMLFIIIVAVLLSAVYFFTLSGKQKKVEKLFSRFETLIERRYVLIQYVLDFVNVQPAKNEEEIVQVKDLSKKAMLPQTTRAEKIKINAELDSAVKTIITNMDNYHKLDGNKKFVRLKGALNKIEVQLEDTTESLYDQASDYNSSINAFPANVMAKMLRYKPADF